MDQILFSRTSVEKDMGLACSEERMEELKEESGLVTRIRISDFTVYLKQPLSKRQAYKKEEKKIIIQIFLYNFFLKKTNVNLI